MNPDKFGKNLKEILEFLEIPQNQFAAMCELTPAAVSQILSGERKPGLETLCRILKVLPIDFERLVK